MPTQEQIEEASKAAEAYSNAKQAHDEAIARAQRSQNVIDAANHLLHTMAADGGADSDLWRAVLAGVGDLQSARASHGTELEDATAAMTKARVEFDNAMLALTASSSAPAPATPRSLEPSEADEVGHRDIKPDNTDEVDVDVEEITKPEHHKTSPHHPAHHKSGPRKGK